jgi:hypothetical protein
MMTIGEKCYEMFQLIINIINIINKSKYIFMCTVPCSNVTIRDAGTIKRQGGGCWGGGQRTPKGNSIDPGEDINLQLCVDLPMKANALNQVTFKVTPHDFAQKASLEM